METIPLVPVDVVDHHHAGRQHDRPAAPRRGAGQAAAVLVLPPTRASRRASSRAGRPPTCCAPSTGSRASSRSRRPAGRPGSCSTRASARRHGREHAPPRHLRSRHRHHRAQPRSLGSHDRDGRAGRAVAGAERARADPPGLLEPPQARAPGPRAGRAAHHQPRRARGAGFEIIEQQQPSFLLDGSVLITGEVDRTTEFEQGFPVHEA